jgi:hypothetical protein
MALKSEGKRPTETESIQRRETVNRALSTLVITHNSHWPDCRSLSPVNGQLDFPRQRRDLYQPRAPPWVTVQTLILQAESLPHDPHSAFRTPEIWVMTRVSTVGKVIKITLSPAGTAEHHV